MWARRTVPVRDRLKKHSRKYDLGDALVVTVKDKSAARKAEATASKKPGPRRAFALDERRQMCISGRVIRHNLSCESHTKQQHRHCSAATGSSPARRPGPQYI